MPYWIVLVPLHTLFVGENLRQHLAQSPGALVCLRINRDQSFLESVPVGLRHAAGRSAETAVALGRLSFDAPRHRDVHDDRLRRFYRSADGAAAELF